MLLLEHLNSALGESCGIVLNAFDYLTELLRHVEELKQNPSEWMPWNYRETLARRVMSAAA